MPPEEVGPLAEIAGYPVTVLRIRSIMARCVTADVSVSFQILTIFRVD